MDIYTRLGSLTGEMGAIHALEKAEKIVFDAYQVEITKDYEPFIKSILDKHVKYEEKHKAYIETLYIE